MNKDPIEDSVLSAIESSADDIAAILRQNAMADGWDRSAASSLSVETEGTDLSITSESKSAADLEYGTDEMRPNPAVRRFINRSKVIEAAILRKANEQLRGVL